MGKTERNLVSCRGLSLASGPFGHAQSGTIGGCCKGSRGAVNPGAGVALVNEGTKFTHSMVTRLLASLLVRPTRRVTVSVALPVFRKIAERKSSRSKGAV